MKKLYTVEVNTTIWVVAEDQLSAEETAREALTVDPESCGVTFYAAEFASDSPPAEWRESIPFGSDDDRTVQEWIDSAQSEED